MIRAMSNELNIFDIVCGANFNKGKTLLEHANQLALFLVKELCLTILANIGFDNLKPVIFMSVTDHASEHRENWRMICKGY